MNEPYHVENLRLLLQSVVERYGDILDADDHGFVSAFEALPASSRSLYTRLVCRQAPCFRLSQLRYNDITDLPSTVSTLLESALVNTQPELANCLHISTKADLQRWFASPRHLKKEALIDFLRSQFSSQALQEELTRQDTWITPLQRERIEKFELCFFGNRHQKLNEFIITELGHVVYEAYELSENTRYFTSKTLLDCSHALSRRQHQLDAQLKGADIDWIRQVEAQLPPALQDSRYTRRRTRTLYQLGREAERRHAWLDAQRLYQHSGNDGSIERLARHAVKQGDFGTAQHLLSSLLDTTHDPDCRTNALRLLRRISPTTNHTLFEPAIERITLPLQAVNIELQVAAHLNEQGHTCFYSENMLFNGLLGLLFWDIIFKAVPGAFANRFQRAPLDLYEPEFILRRQTDVSQRLDLIHKGGAEPLIARHLTEKQGTANTLVHWEFFQQTPWQAVLAAMPPHQLERILGHMLQDLGQRRAGFPDLFCLYADGTYRLMEVKGPNDTLRENQREWLAFFATQDIPATVLHVSPTPSA